MTYFTIILPLALRNLRRQIRRTALTASAMIIGGALLIFTLSFGDGAHEQWIDSGVRQDSGHITIERPNFRITRKIEDRLPEQIRLTAEQAIETLRSTGYIDTASSKLTVLGLASSPAGARPVQIIGVDPVSEALFTTLDDLTIEGRYLESTDTLAAFVGIGLMRSLDLEIGSRLVLTAQDTTNEIAGQLVRVTGAFETGVEAADQSLVHIPINTANDWLTANNAVTNIGILVEPSHVAPQISSQLQQILGASLSMRDVAVMNWKEAMPELASAVMIDDFGAYVVNGLLLIVIAFGIINTVLMSVLHRHREFGVLQALGLSPKQTSAIVLSEGLVLTTVSGVLGIVISISLSRYFLGDGIDLSALVPEGSEISGTTIDPVVIPMFRTARIVQSFGWILVIGLISSIYPAVRASRIDITESMKFDR